MINFADGVAHISETQFIDGVWNAITPLMFDQSRPYTMVVKTVNDDAEMEYKEYLVAITAVTRYGSCWYVSYTMDAEASGAGFTHAVDDRGVIQHSPTSAVTCGYFIEDVDFWTVSPDDLVSQVLMVRGTKALEIIEWLRTQAATLDQPIWNEVTLERTRQLRRDLAELERVFDDWSDTPSLQEVIKQMYYSLLVVLRDIDSHVMSTYPLPLARQKTSLWTRVKSLWRAINPFSH